MMWHEAKKQEKKIRGLMVDYKRRAERRRDYYEKIRADPTQFIQIHGRPCKIHLDPSVALAADSPATMMSWQGDRDILIDRFDVRAHLDLIPEVYHTSGVLSEEESQEERFNNYERYRILVQNDFLGISEDKFFTQLALEEQCGPIAKNETSIEGKKKSQLNAAIGYKYDSGPDPGPSSIQEESEQKGDEEEDVDEDDDSDIDFDLSVDVSKVDTANAIELNNCAHSYGMESNDYFSFLTKDMEEAETLRLAKEEEEEKAMFAGRKSRRERRAFREKSMVGRKLSPLSFATKISPTYGIQKEPDRVALSKSKSRSPSPINSGKIMYITSFGEAEELNSQIESRNKITSSNCYNKRPRSSSKHRYSPSSSKEKKSRRSSPHNNRSYKTKSKSKSPRKFQPSRSRNNSKSPHRSPPTPPVRRYYGRNVRRSSSELEISDSDTSSNSKTTNFSMKNISVVSKSTPSSSTLKITPQERLKKKMQKLLNKQFKADKKAEREKNQKLEQERYERAEEMRELSLKLKLKEKQKRYDSDETYDDEHHQASDSDDDKKSDVSKHTPSYRRNRSRSNSNSRSRYRPKHISRTPSPQNKASSPPLHNSRGSRHDDINKDQEWRSNRHRDYKRNTYTENNRASRGHYDDFSSGISYRGNYNSNKPDNCRRNFGYHEDGGRRFNKERYNNDRGRPHYSGYNRDDNSRRDSYSRHNSGRPTSSSSRGLVDY